MHDYFQFTHLAIIPIASPHPARESLDTVDTPVVDILITGNKA